MHLPCRRRDGPAVRLRRQGGRAATAVGHGPHAALALLRLCGPGAVEPREFRNSLRAGGIPFHVVTVVVGVSVVGRLLTMLLMLLVWWLLLCLP